MNVTTQTAPSSIITEIFPIVPAALPTVTAYQPLVRNGDFSTVAGKLAYRLPKFFPGHWVSTGSWIVSDLAALSEQDLQNVVESLWGDQDTAFQSLVRIQHLPAWHPTPQAQADFVARGLWPDLKVQADKVLEKYRKKLADVELLRACHVRGWDIQGEPAISVSIDTQILMNQTVQAYLSKQTSHDDVKDLLVADKLTSLKGTILGVVGPVGEHRKRLLGYGASEQAKKHMLQAEDHESVVQVQAYNRKSYDYVARSLNIIIRTSDYKRFGVNGQQITSYLRIAPDVRSTIVKEISSLLKQRGWIAVGYNSKQRPDLFLRPTDIHFTPGILVGRQQLVTDLKDTVIQSKLRQYGVYKRVFPMEGRTLSIGVLNTLPQIDATEFLKRLQNELLQFKFPSQMCLTETITDLNSHQLGQTIQKLQQQGADIILGIFANENTTPSDSTRWNAYDFFKSLTISNDIPTQVINPSTMNNNYALGNIALGMLSKLGNVPYILANTLPYADIVVGIDIARRRKTRLEGSINATATTRVYQNTGEFLQYSINDTLLEGETIPAHVLQTLFSPTIFAGKRVVVHRDGLFRGDEKKVLQSWAHQLGSEFFLVEVLKTGTPRCYQVANGLVSQPTKGSIFKLNAHEAFLVSSLPPFSSVTAAPLHIRCEAPFTIEQAAHSVLALTQLHYGSLRGPRLPVTLHYSDEIAYLVLKGIKPKSLEGSRLFWL